MSALLLAAGSSGLSAAATPLPPPSIAPNIVVITVDGLGYADVGNNGARDVATPNIERLAAEGVFFPHGYVVQMVCSPSRASLITGRYSVRFRYEGNVDYDPFDESRGLPVAERTVASPLRDAGYRTGIVGKWHLGGAERFIPKRRGFDHFFGFLAGTHRYFETDTREVVSPRGHSAYTPLVEGDASYHLEGRYITAVLTDKAIDFVQEGGDKPFFLYLPYNLPHDPYEAPEAAVAKYGHIDGIAATIWPWWIRSTRTSAGSWMRWRHPACATTRSSTSFQTKVPMRTARETTVCSREGSQPWTKAG